jgi:hypothetical protein
VFTFIYTISVAYILSPVDLNALAWLEDYLQTWPGTLLVVSGLLSFLFVKFGLYLTTDLTIELFWMQLPLTLSISTPVALITTKGISLSISFSSCLMPFPGTLHNSIQPSQNVIEICARSTTHRWSTESIFKLSLTGGDTMPIAVG